jgi:hypothetical protein
MAEIKKKAVAVVMAAEAETSNVEVVRVAEARVVETKMVIRMKMNQDQDLVKKTAKMVKCLNPSKNSWVWMSQMS